MLGPLWGLETAGWEKENVFFLFFLPSLCQEHKCVCMCVKALHERVESGKLKTFSVQASKTQLPTILGFRYNRKLKAHIN